MSEMTNTSEILLARLAEGLDSTAKMTQTLLSDLRESEADFAAMRAELNILKENVKGLSELVRDGGTSSILTRVALIEQNIDNIKKWMDNHVDVHQRMKKDFSEVREQLVEIERRLSTVEETIREIEEEAQERAREQRDSIVREMDLAAEKQKADEMVRAQTQSAKAKVRAERQSAIVKIIATVVIGLIGLAGGYLMKSCTGNDPGAEPTRFAPTSSGSPQTP
jgi:DNA repair exonuclease SbcCD ATPase subunit